MLNEFLVDAGDRFGRKRAMFCGMFIVVPSVILGGFVSNYLGYIILRLLSCTCIVFSWIAGHNFQVKIEYPTNIGIVRGTVSVATIVVVSAGVEIWLL